MSLSNDLVLQFVKITNDKDKAKSETTVYGTVKVYDGSTYVQIDGSELLTPISTTADIKDKDRVTVMIKNHEAVVTGNITSPAARTEDVENKASSEDVDELVEAYAVITETLTAANGDIKDLQTDNVSIKERLTAAEGDIDTLTTDKLNAADATLTYATIKSLEALDAKVDGLTVGDLDAVYANIDFSNITAATMEYFYSKSGLIHNVVVGDSNITGELVGVTISGDLIEGNTVVADKLVIRGEDGLYYKLNTDGMTTEAEQTEYNSLDGSVILAKSITATKISVDDLVAFDATIGGFSITDSSIYSGVKETIDNSTRGIYLDADGQIYIGDAENFLRYFQDDDGNYKLEISAESILFGSDSRSSVSDLQALTEHVRISTYTDPESGEVNPSIELAEGDSEFKQVITNKSAMYMDGAIVRTEMNTDGVTTDNVTIKNELRHDSWVWQVRANGNYGLSWKG